MTTKPQKLLRPCHYGNVLVSDTPFPLYGAGWSRGFHTVKDAIVIDLADVIHEPKVMFWNMEIPSTLRDRYATDAQVIRITWADGGIPSIAPSFWYKLVDYLVEQNKTVIIACMGGHGRTGTALALIAGILRLHGDADIGEWVRAHHCKEAIETYAQVDYIADVLGEETAIIPSWAYELNTWKNWKSANVYKDKKGTCTSHPSTDEQKVFGWFDKNDIYHTGHPKDGDDVTCTVGADADGNDVFEYIYDKESDEFLPSY